MEAKEEVRKLSAEYEQVINDILSVLASMENPSHVKLLTELYILNQTVESVAKREHVTLTCLYKRCNRAFIELETLLNS